LETSNVPVIIITAVAAPANSLDSPITEKVAADPDIARAVTAIINGNVIFLKKENIWD
jgi:hypothetical protein|tara:strand:+ start:1930 stop:2103 length:174 start_codon:yes stop_codon:yes gene_type:complete